MARIQTRNRKIMKTPMQEVLDLVEQMYSNAKTPEVESAINDIINILTQEGIPKEKEHMKNAFESGWNWNFSSEKYYNETYNENK